MIPQDLAQRHVDGAADTVGGEHLAPEVFDGVDWTIGANQVFVGIIVVDPVLVEIADGSKIVHMRVLDGEAERGKSQRSNIEFARRQRSDLGSAPAEMDELDSVGFSVVRQQLRPGENDRGKLTRNYRPADAKLEQAPPIEPRTPRSLATRRPQLAAPVPSLSAFLRRSATLSVDHQRPPGRFLPAYPHVGRWMSTGPPPGHGKAVQRSTRRGRTGRIADHLRRFFA